MFEVIANAGLTITLAFAPAIEVTTTDFDGAQLTLQVSQSFEVTTQPGIAVDVSFEVQNVVTQQITAIAGENLNGHTAVYFGPAGTLLKADSSLLKPATGYIRDSVSIGEPVALYLPGSCINGFSSLTLEATYYLSTLGQLTTTPPSTGILQALGTPKSSTEFIFSPTIAFVL